MSAFSHAITQIHFDPLLPEIWLFILCGGAAMLLLFSLWQNPRTAVLRVICITLVMLALLNPAVLQKEREPTKDVAVIVLDESASQSMGERQARSAAALSYLQNKLGSFDTLEIRIVKAPQEATLARDTRLFDAIERELADVPLQRRAGVVIISDGQIHDVPKNTADFAQFGPVHLLLSGEHAEKDRRLEIVEAPSYGIVGGSVDVRYVIRDTDNIGATMAEVQLQDFTGEPLRFLVPVGEEQNLTLPLGHAGETIFELSVAGVDNEITLANNRAALRVNGVRDRLKVLLVSGKPHAGGRTWRDLLTSDPGVDLVHFTILREPSKIDMTPQNELALIAFPFRELFEIKLYEFDLIIFDRYRLTRILPPHYFNNIATYVQKGGALLEASGPSFSSQDSIYYTDIGRILPAKPAGEVLSAVFKPHISAGGARHPVTEGLSGAGGDTPQWGPWLRQVPLEPVSGDVLMDGIDGNPLLIMDRVGQGRVAQIASDHIWLWSRGYRGGGPHAELLRRVVHWLMKEPELDEKALDITVDGQSIRVRSRDSAAESLPLAMTKPDGSHEDIVLKRDETGFLQTTIQADQLGIYAFSSGIGTADAQLRFAVIGENNPPELRDVLTTPDILAPLIKASGGGALWLDDTPNPAIRRLSQGVKNYAGGGWIGLRDNNDFTVKSVKSLPLLPPFAWFGLIASALLFMWWREGRQG
ncbi:MAG: hypothetical protein ACPGRX_01375 [Bdellovibrionales bacterium]